MTKWNVDLGEVLCQPLPPEIQAAEDARIADFMAGLPDASGTFTGTYSSDADVTALLGPVPDLMPIEIDTGDEPNPAAGPMAEFTIRVGDDEWTLPVDHVDLLGSNRVRVWVRRPALA